MNLLKCSLSIFLIISSLAQAGQIKIKHFSNAKIHRIFNDLEVQDTGLFEIAQNLEGYRVKYRGYKSNQVRIDKAKMILDQIKAKETLIFQPFQAWLQTLIRLNESENVNQTQKICLLQNINIEHDFLIKQVRRSCHDKFLLHLGKFIAGGEYFTADHLEYVKSEFRLMSQKYKQIYKFLKQAQKNITVYQVVKKEFKELYSKNSTIKISRQLAKKLQIKKVPKKARLKETYSLTEEKYKELKKRISKTIGLIENKTSEKEILKDANANVIEFFKKNEDILPAHDSLERILKLGEYFTRRKKFSVSRRLFSFVDSRSDKFDNEVHFGYLWSYIQKDDWDQALVYIRYNKLDKRYKNYDSKINFWVAETLLKKENERIAHNIFNFIIRNQPLSYYAVMAAKKVNQLNEKPFVKIDSHPYQGSLVAQDHDFKINPKRLPLHIKNTFKRLQLFSHLKNSPFMYKELDQIFNSLHELRLMFPHATMTQIKADFSLLTAHILHKNHQHLETFKLVYKGINKKYLSFTPQVIKMLFPQPFIGEVRKQLDKKIDPLVVVSLMRQESSFNPIARSPVGAMGLMQLMPATARQFKRRVKTKQLKNPKMNIDLGTQYVEYLMGKYDNNLVYTLAAYNAGESNVAYWEKNYFSHNSVLKDIENIPFNETRKYVKLIYRNIFLYKFINAREHLSDAYSPNKIFDLSLNYPTKI